LPERLAFQIWVVSSQQMHQSRVLIPRGNFFELCDQSIGWLRDAGVEGVDSAAFGSSLQALKYRAVQSNVPDRIQRDIDNKTSAQTGCLIAYTSDELALRLTERVSQIRHKAALSFKGECRFARYQGTSGIRGKTVLMIFKCDSIRILAVIGLSGLLMSCAGGTGESAGTGESENSEAAEHSAELPDLGAGLPAVEQPQAPQPQTAQPPSEQAKLIQSLIWAVPRLMLT